MQNIVTVMKAAELASKWHAGQRRKGDAAEPYLNHLIEVASLVATASGGNETYTVAALLHDAVEDQDVTFPEIEGIFGAEVANIVNQVTDDKSLDKQERKRLQIVNAPKKGEGACYVKLADKTSNIRSLLMSPPPWPIARKLEYVAWARLVVGGLAYKPESLVAEFDKACADLKRALETETAA